MGSWKLQDAKARFSEVVDRALEDGPQIVTRHGKKVVVVVAYKDFAKEGPLDNFKRFLTSVPLNELELRRSRRKPRKLAF